MELIVEFRSNLFGGWTTNISGEYLESVEDIIALAVSKLFQFLEENKLKMLIRHLDECTFKIDMKLEDILKKPEAPVIIEQIENEEDKCCDCEK